MKWAEFRFHLGRKSTRFFPKEDNELRKMLYPILKAAKREKRVAYLKSKSCLLMVLFTVAKKHQFFLMGV